MNYIIPYFFTKIEKNVAKFVSAAVVIDTLRVKMYAQNRPLFMHQSFENTQQPQRDNNAEILGGKVAGYFQA